MLVSFQLASKYPANLIGLLENLERSASDPACFEVLVKVDTEDDEMQAAVRAEVSRRKFRLRQVVSGRGRGYEDLWMALNEVYKLTDPSAYFVCNLNDEVRIRETDWDTKLRRYVGLFPDHIYRLRTSRLKFRNYYDFWECGFAPENYAFYTKRWLDICGDWNPCFGPDSCQQYIAYYLGYANYPGIKQFNRDVPVLDISWKGEGVGHNLSSEQKIQRNAVNFRLWKRQVSHAMQEELFRRARLLQANIVQAECASRCRVEIIDERPTRTLLLRDADDHELLDLLPYKINRIGLALRNFRRTLRFGYYAGGGREGRHLLPVSILLYLITRYPYLRRFAFATEKSLFALLRGPQRLLLAFQRGILSFAARTKLLYLITRYPYLRRLAFATEKSLFALLRGPQRLLLAFQRGILGFAARNITKRRKTGRRSIGSTILGSLIRAAHLCFRSWRYLVRPLSWKYLSGRLALALRDSDVRWLTIKPAAMARLAPSQDPWFEAEDTVTGNVWREQNGAIVNKS